jgi:hypothetical protein
MMFTKMETSLYLLRVPSTILHSSFAVCVLSEFVFSFNSNHNNFHNIPISIEIENCMYVVCCVLLDNIFS